MIMFEASYYNKFKNSPSNQLIDALIKAKKRGVDVEVILDIRQKSDRSTIRNLETGKRLTAAGLKVIFDTERITTHSKLLIIDEKIVVKKRDGENKHYNQFIAKSGVYSDAKSPSGFLSCFAKCFSFSSSIIKVSH